MIVIIDNYDSFTYNLYQYIGEINHKINVFRNDKITIEELKQMNISHIVISPGPGYPDNAGISMEVIKEFGKHIPILGVCLGHQCIGQVYGAEIVKSNNIMHGKNSLIYHNNKDLFKNIKNPLNATRYHSLVVDNESMTEEIVITAKTKQNEIMGLKHIKYPIFGVQFHPESIASEGGKQIIKNFLSINKKRQANHFE